MLTTIVEKIKHFLSKAKCDKTDISNFKEMEFVTWVYQQFKLKDQTIASCVVVGKAIHSDVVASMVEDKVDLNPEIVTLLQRADSYLVCWYNEVGVPVGLEVVLIDTSTPSGESKFKLGEDMLVRLDRDGQIRQYLADDVASNKLKAC